LRPVNVPSAGGAAPTAAQIAAVRQKIVRAIHPEPFDKKGELFPEAYRPAAPIGDELPPPPRWWWFASLGITAFALLLWLLLFLWAGTSPRSADEVVTRELEQVRDRGPRRTPPTVPDPAPVDPIRLATDEAEAPEGSVVPQEGRP